ncbi:MAG: TCR/Tet family MFS transporter [Telmatospirillum sp.]|nr:TCR/Tet family MFS transporter [Telmatospirillum sp.]
MPAPPEPALSPHEARHVAAVALFVVFLDMVSLGMIIPVLPRLVAEVGHVGLDGAAAAGGWLFAVFSLAQFLCAPFMGTLADHIGRRPLLLLAIGGLALDYVIQALAPSLTWLFAGRMLAGVCGSSYVIANACLADVTAPERRARAFGWTTAAFGLGFVLGPAIGGLLGTVGTRVPFWCASALAGANFLLGACVLPETLRPENRRRFRWRDANPLGSLLVFRSLPGVLPMAMILGLYFFGSSIYMAIWPYWGIAKFGWSTTTVGVTLATSGLSMALLQGLATGPAVARWGEKPVAVAGLAVAASACVAFSLARTTELVVLLLVVHAIEGFVHPMLTALMSSTVPEDSQGALQGGISAIMNLAMLAGTIFFTQIFGFFLPPQAPFASPDVPFHAAATILAVTLVLFLHQTRTRTTSSPH